MNFLVLFGLFTSFPSLAFEGKQPEQAESSSRSEVALIKSNDNNPTKKTKIFDIKFLKKFSEKKSSLEIHNKALQFLKTGYKEQAILLLKRNIYQNFFLPSYLILFHLEISVSPNLFIWHIGLILLAVICFFSLFLCFKKSNSSRLKAFFWSFGFFTALLALGFFLLKNRVGSFEELALKSAPFIDASVNARKPAGSDLIVLKQTKHWLRVQSPDAGTGWILKQDVFHIFEKHLALYSSSD